MFPELRKPLVDVYGEAVEGSEYVIAKYRTANCNLRTQFKRILLRAGIKPWPRPFQNLRASRASELAEEYPSHVAAEWLGHSEEIADAQYRDTLDIHVARAIAGSPDCAAQNCTQPTPDNAGQPPTLVGATSEKSPESPNLSEKPGLGDTPKGSRTPVLWLRTRYPGPLDDRGVFHSLIVLPRAD